MKKHVYEGIRRWLSLGLCLCLAAGYVPLPALAEGCGHVHGEGCYTVTTDCVHIHEADCWSDMDLQAAGEEADVCGHICSEDTGCVTAVLSCGHVHDGDCGYAVAQAVEEQQPEEQKPEKQEPEKQEPEKQEPEKQEPGGQEPGEQEPEEQEPEEQEPQEQPQVKTVTAWTWVDEQEALDPETGKLYLTASQDAPVFYDQIVEVLPQAIEAMVDGETETLPLTHWESADYPQETGAYSGSYRFTASLPEGYALAEDAAALDVTVEFGGAVTLTDCTHTKVNQSTGACEACGKVLYDALVTMNPGTEQEQTLLYEKLKDIDSQKSKKIRLLRDITLGRDYWQQNCELDGNGFTINECSLFLTGSGSVKNIKLPSPGQCGYSIVISGADIKIGSGCVLNGLTLNVSGEISAHMMDGIAFYRDEAHGQIADHSGTTLNGMLYTGPHTRHVFPAGSDRCGCTYQCGHTAAEIDMTTGSCLCGQVRFYEAKIGAKGYTTLAKAIAAAGETDTVILLTDLNLTDIITIDKAMSLDLNGHNLIQTGNQTVLNITGGAVTLTDNSTTDFGKQGKITHAAGTEGNGIFVSDTCTFCMSGGIVSGNSTGICNYGTAALSGGIINANRGMSAGYGGGIANFGDLIIQGPVNIAANTNNGKASNLYLGNEAAVTLEKPASGFSVGVTTAAAVDIAGTVIAKGDKAKVQRESFNGFTSEEGAACRGVSEEGGEFVLRFYSIHDYTGRTDGICNRCSARCDHSRTSPDTGECLSCGQLVCDAAVIVDGKRTACTTIEKAVDMANAATGNSITVKLLKNDVQWVESRDISRTMTLDLDGYDLKYKSNDYIRIGTGATLSLVDSKGTGTAWNVIIGQISNYTGSLVVEGGNWKFGSIYARYGDFAMTGGELDTVTACKKAEVRGGMIKNLKITPACKTVLSGGNFDSIDMSSVDSDEKQIKAASLLEAGYAFQRGKEMLRYNELPTLDKGTSLDIVCVVRCSEHVFEAGNSGCIYCNASCEHKDIDLDTGRCKVCAVQIYQARIDRKGYETLNAAIAAAGENDTVILLTELYLNTKMFIDKTVTLDLNGCNLIMQADQAVMWIREGTVTLTDHTKDAAKQGKIMHANGGCGEGVVVESGTFRMTGGIICDTSDSYSSFRTCGVYVWKNGTFQMEGGVIQNNVRHGGVTNKGTTILSGGAITANSGTSDEYSGGITNFGRLIVRGNVNITGNTKDDKPRNLYLGSGCFVTLEKPTSGFSVGITTEDAVGTDGLLIAKGSTEKVTKADFSGIFSDTGEVCKGLTEENEEYVLRYYSAHDYTGTTTGQCTRCGAAHDHTGHLVNGVCEICHYVCTHESVKESGGVYTCNACGKEMCVRFMDPNKPYRPMEYYADFGQAVAALNGTKLDGTLDVELLKDTVISQPVTLQNHGSLFQLNILLNGKKITGEPLTITGNIRVAFSADADSTVEAEVILENVSGVAVFPNDYHIFFQKITDKSGAIKKEPGTANWEFSDSAQNWIHWDSIPDGAYTYENVTASGIPVRVSVPSEGTMSYGGSMPESFQGAKMEKNGGMSESIVSGYTYTVSWWLGQEKLEEKQVGNDVSYGPNNSDRWAGLAAGTYTVTCRMSATKEGARDYVISKQVKLTVNKAPVGSVTAPTLNTGLTYTGQPQALLAAGGSAQGGTLVYSLTEDGTYTAAVPTGTNAGSYEIWYKVQGDGNHLDTAAQSLGTVTVARKDVTVTGTQVQASRTYDGTNTAVITSPGTVQGNADGENLIVLPGTASIADKNVGTGKTVTFSGFTLGGSAKDNYNLTAQPGSTTADITPLKITAQVTPQDKDYDGTDTATAGVQLQGVLTGDSLTLKPGTVRFAGKAAGTHKLIFTGFTLDGADKSNYSLTIPETSGTIRATNDYLDLTGTGLENSGSITLEGRAYPIVEEDGKYYVDLTGITGTYVTAYGYANAGSQDIHTQYPNTMTVHRLDRTNAEGKGAKLIRIQELDDLLLYEGCSIRLTGNKGIRMITSIDEQTKKSLINGSLAGFTLEEYGTVVIKGIGEPTLGNTQSQNFAYSKINRKDPVFARENGRIQYTNVLVNFQPADYNTELTLRPYITLVDGDGNTVTLYGGCVTRTIRYIAQQNMNLGIYKPGSAGYRYLENILNGK